MSNGIVIWVLAGVGILLVYSAYKNQNPLNIIKGVLQTTPATA